eukprot:5324226-Prymnesium_polylepis.1
MAGQQSKTHVPLWLRPKQTCNIHDPHQRDTAFALAGAEAHVRPRGRRPEADAFAQDKGGARSLHTDERAERRCRGQHTVRCLWRPK